MEPSMCFQQQKRLRKNVTECAHQFGTDLELLLSDGFVQITLAAFLAVDRVKAIR